MQPSVLGGPFPYEGNPKTERNLFLSQNVLIIILSIALYIPFPPFCLTGESGVFRREVGVSRWGRVNEDKRQH